MGKLNEVFKDVTELEIQLLTVLPNLVTIPFILCSGKICTPRNRDVYPRYRPGNLHNNGCALLLRHLDDTAYIA